MDGLIVFDAIHIPFNGRIPTIVPLATFPASSTNSTGARIPCPEVYMDYIAEVDGKRAWGYQVRVLFSPVSPVACMSPTRPSYHVL